jgi:hypothetical protein
MAKVDRLRHEQEQGAIREPAYRELSDLSSTVSRGPRNDVHSVYDCLKLQAE